jgi:hypothetical protein
MKAPWRGSGGVGGSVDAESSDVKRVVYFLSFDFVSPHPFSTHLPLLLLQYSVIY